MALGAGHALTPGHGKTLMGAYLVGTRGTPVHAVALGLSVTVSHTLGILVLAAIVIALRGVIPPETFNRVGPDRLRAAGPRHRCLAGRRPGPRTTDELGERRPRPRPRPRDTIATTMARTRPDDREAPAELGTHSHGGITHSHLPAAGSSVSWRSLFVLGLAGGIIPSTNALIILLATIATGRAAYGLVLVVAFGLGMAVVLGGVGLGLVFARDRLDGCRPARASAGSRRTPRWWPASSSSRSGSTSRPRRSGSPRRSDRLTRGVEPPSIRGPVATSL